MKGDIVYVTGVGVVSGLGVGKEAHMEALRTSRSAIGEVRYLDTSHKELPVSEVPYSNEEMMSMLGLPADAISTRTALMGRLALREAITEAHLNPELDHPAFISGTTVGGMDKSEQYYLDFLSNDSRNDYIKTHDCGTCSEMIAEEYRGFSMMTTLSTACSSAANAILIGTELIQSGRYEIVVVGGSECITKFHLNGFKTLMILDDKPCRPFDKSRAGLNLGEGAAYLVLESASSVRRRAVKPLCQVSGCGNRCDAFHQTASSPDGEGPYLAMTEALNNAGLRPSDIDYINAHGTSTAHNDISEGTAIMRVFGNNIPLVASIKAFIGHTTSAAGTVEAAIAIMAIQHQFAPCNLNYNEKIEELSFEPLKESCSKAINHVMSNSFGFGGNDTVCIFSKVKEELS